jgi:hypothetical protein
MLHEFTTGRSGSTVTLIDYNGKPAVHKTNVRSADAVVRQMDEVRDWGLRVPEVYHSTPHTLTIEYIPGCPVREFMYCATVKQLDSFVDTIKLYMDNAISRSRPHNFSAEIAAKELSTGYQARITNPLFPRYNIHGDLTIDNLLFHNNEFYFIDFSYTELNSPVFDLNKLRQDLTGLWAWRGRVDLGIKMQIDYIARRLAVRYPLYWRNDIYRFQLSRVLPYVTGGEYEYIMREIQRCE